MTVPRTAFKVPIKLTYLRTLSPCCELSSSMSKHLRHRLWIDMHLVRVNTEAQPLEQIYCELAISKCLRAAASTAPNIVDISHTSDQLSVETSNCW